MTDSAQSERQSYDRVNAAHGEMLDAIERRRVAERDADTAIDRYRRECERHYALFGEDE